MISLKKKRQLFLSHCSSDKEIVERLHGLLKNVLGSKWKIFYTSLEENSTTAGKERGEELRENISKSEIMCVVITDNYLRSAPCIAELSACWYRNMPILPIVFSTEGASIFPKLFGKDIIYIDAKDCSNPQTCKNAAKKTVKVLIDYGVEIKNIEENQKQFEEFFSNSKMLKSHRSFIGGEYIAELLRYCDNNGITNIRDTARSFDTKEKQRLIHSNKIYFLMTTGQRLISSMVQEIIPQALKNKCEIHLILPNKGSEFCYDVARIETPETSFENFQRISEEYDQCVNLLQSEYIKVLRQMHGDKESIGKIFIHCSYTILRQTIFLAIEEENVNNNSTESKIQAGHAWGWITMTMPPKRAVAGTPSIDIEGKIKLNENISSENKELTIESDNLVQRAYNHIKSLIDLSYENKDVYQLTDTTKEKEFYLEKNTALQYWKKKYDSAQALMLQREIAGGDILIEIAAQHPLNTNGTPGEEFSKRLDLGIELYNRLKKENKNVKIYVPGSLHMHNGVVDIKSLSDAGTTYLRQHGISDDSLIGETANLKYKGDDGVYNSADECYVAAKLFLDSNFSQLHCVCSPGQIARKELFYMEFGVIPYFHSVSCLTMFHNTAYELLETLPRVLLKDHSWQKPDSIDGIRTRMDRNPALKSDI